MEIDIINLISPVGALRAGGGLGMLSKSGRIKAKSEAMKAMSEAYEMRITSLHTIIDNHNQTDIENSKRISELNHALNSKTDQIRNLTGKMYSSEQEINRVQDLLNDAKDTIIMLTEERDEERRRKEYYKRWRCEKSTCEDPEGRRPPNSKLATETYIHPEKENLTIINLTKNA
ncbi:MAG: hypothetical protein K2N96_01740, partial [Muribaculaceae bacterium]|nr:hypothetical protein [Muribaculaceae bacterium]